MDVWKLISPNNLAKESQEIPEPTAGQVKVRITKVLFDSFDREIYRGNVKVKYPLIPGRFAIGRVASENNPSGFEKGMRVVLHTYLPDRDTGTAKVDFSEDDYAVRGLTEQGYLRDFICVNEDELTVIPDSVSDEAALNAEMLATARQAVDALDVQKGQHIAVFGADLLGNLISRVLIYQQAAPILIDNRTARLDFAKKCGVYYTSPADDTLIDNVAQVTGGRLADGAIFVTSSGPQNTALPFKVSSYGSNVVYCGFQGSELNVDLYLALHKQITVHGVKGGQDYIPTALNLIANKAIDFSLFRTYSFEISRIKDEISNVLKDRDETVGVMVVGELI